MDCDRPALFTHIVLSQNYYETETVFNHLCNPVFYSQTFTLLAVNYALEAISKLGASRV